MGVEAFLAAGFLVGWGTDLQARRLRKITLNTKIISIKK